MIIINNHHYDDWQANFLSWNRKTSYPRLVYGKVSICLTEYKKEIIWYPEFVGELISFQEIYDQANGDIIFKHSQEKMAMDYVDQFVTKMNKLAVFL